MTNTDKLVEAVARALAELDGMHPSKSFAAHGMHDGPYPDRPIWTAYERQAKRHITAYRVLSASPQAGGGE